MRTLLGIGALVLGVVGVLVCAAAVGIGWWVAVGIVTRLDRVAARLDRGFAEVDGHLARVETRMNVVRGELDEFRAAADKIAADNPELPRVRAEIERLLGRLGPTFERLEILADSLRREAEVLRTAGEIVDELFDDPDVTDFARSAADRIDRGAESLNGLRARIEASKAAKAVELTRELVALARAAIAGSERLAEALASAREGIATARARAAEWRDKIVFWIYVAATASTFVWLWGGVGQLCLIGWGRGCFSSEVDSSEVDVRAEPEKE